MPEGERLIQFDSLRARLIAGGVARRHIKRTLAELHDHYDDTVDDGTAQGLSPDAAAQAAWQRLGSEDEIVATVLARPELRSLPARYPRLVFGTGPVLLWAAGTACSLLLIMTIAKVCQLAGILPTRGTAKRLDPMWVQHLGHALMFFYMRVWPVVIGAGMAMMAARLRLVPGWTVGGAVVVSLLSAFSTYALIFATVPGQPGQLNFGWGVSAAELPQTVALTVVNVGLIGLAYWFGQQRRGIK